MESKFNFLKKTCYLLHSPQNIISNVKYFPEQHNYISIKIFSFIFFISLHQHHSSSATSSFLEGKNLYCSCVRHLPTLDVYSPDFFYMRDPKGKCRKNRLRSPKENRALIFSYLFCCKAPSKKATQ